MDIRDPIRKLLNLLEIKKNQIIEEKQNSSVKIS